MRFVRRVCVCVCVYMYIHTHTRVCMYIYIYIYMYTHTHIYIYAFHVILTIKDCNIPIQHSPVGISSGRALCPVTIISLILQLSEHIQLNICIGY